MDPPPIDRHGQPRTTRHQGARTKRNGLLGNTMNTKGRSSSPNGAPPRPPSQASLRGRAQL